MHISLASDHVVYYKGGMKREAKHTVTKVDMAMKTREREHVKKVRYKSFLNELNRQIRNFEERVRQTKKARAAELIGRKSR